MSKSSNGTLLLIAFVCGMSLHAQTTAATVRAPLPEQAQSQGQYGGSVSGHVYCADTNAPARFARVMLTPVRTGGDVTRGGYFSQPQATTGLDGSFLIQSVATGTYYVTAAMPGYLNLLSEISAADVTSGDPAVQSSVGRILTPISVNGSDGAHAEIRLERGASLSGTVYYDDGSPAVNAQINVRPATTSGTVMASAWLDRGTTGAFGQQEQHTDDYGRYRVSGLPAGDYVVTASSQFVDPQGFSGFGRGRQLNTLIVYAPKNFRSVDAKIFTLKTGSELNGVDISIPLAAFHTVSGTAESSDGHTLNSGNLTLADDKDKTHVFHTNVTSDGQFRFLYVTEGSYTLTLLRGAVTEPSTTAGTGNSRGRNRSTVVQSYNTVTQSVLVENGDLSGVVVQAAPVAPAPAATATAPAP